MNETLREWFDGCVRMYKESPAVQKALINQVFNGV